MKTAEFSVLCAECSGTKYYFYFTNS